MVWPRASMWNLRQHSLRARALRAALVGLCAWSAGPLPAAAAPAQRPAKRISVQLLVIGEHETEGPITAARVSAQRVDEPGPPLEVAVTGAGAAIDLEPGVWSLIARAPGRVERQQVLTLVAATPLRFVLPLARVTVALQLGPPEAVAAGATWTLARDGSEVSEVFAAKGAREELSLQPGAWHGRVAAPGFVTQEFAWTIGEAAPAIVLERVAVPVVAEQAPPPAPPAADPRLGLGLGLGLSGVVSLGLGVGLLVQHRDGYARFEAAPNNAGFVAALAASSAGAGLVGSGLGLGVVGLSAGFTTGEARRTSKVRDRLLWIEAAVGGGLALIGAAWYAREWQDVQKDLYDAAKDPDMDGTPSGHDPKAQRRETAAAAVMGAGAGLMLGAGVALVTRSVLRLRGGGERRAGRWTLAGGPGQLGLGLRGRF